MKVKITIDGRPLQVDSGLTILQAARQNQIYIPTLCDYPTLSPHGSCRLCIVELKGTDRTPTACTTPVEEGMSVRTNTPQLRHLRSETLKMILSEHPVSCLLCQEQSNCEECMITLRKTSLTTGCNSCPKNGICELQDLVENIGIIGFDLPVRYRMLPIEREDPFFDRDYNLCIHCARCVRICESIHFTGTLTYVNKGPDTRVGTAFGRNHMEAGCSFCGACVEVCPTGALSEKTRKWEGVPDNETLTTCPLCSIGCQMWVLSKNDHVIGSMSAQLPGDGHLCVKGKFGITEMVNHPNRLVHPLKLQGQEYQEISWDEATKLVADKLSACMPQQFGMLVSANNSNEDLYIAQKFTRAFMGSHNISTTAREFYGEAFPILPSLLKRSVSWNEIEKSPAILCLGLDTRFAQSAVEARLVRAKQHGATIVTVQNAPHNLANHADWWIQPTLDEETQLFEGMAEISQTHDFLTYNWKVMDKRLVHLAEQTIQVLLNNEKPLLIVGSRYLRHPNRAQILESIKEIADNIGAKIIVLLPHNNITGSLLMGAYPEYLPGGIPSYLGENIQTLRNLWGKGIPEYRRNDGKQFNADSEDIRVLYIVGDTVHTPEVDNQFVIYQNFYPPSPGCKPDLILPASAFTETEGSYLNHQGRLLATREAVNPPKEAKPSWKILCEIAEGFGSSGFDFKNVQEIQNEIANLVTGFEPDSRVDMASLASIEQTRTNKEITQFTTPSTNNQQDWPFLLTAQVTEHTYSGFSLNTWVEGLRLLYPEEVLYINPDDAAQLEIKSGENVNLRSPEFEKLMPVWIDKYQNRGTLTILLPPNSAFESIITPAVVRKNNV